MAREKTRTSNADIDCSLSQNCLDYLKINKQPFAADILTENTFLNFPELDKIIENLRHQIQFSDLLLIIEGPFGSGKTSLFRQLTRDEIETTKLLPIQAEATDTLIHLQQKMSMHLQDMGSASYLEENLKILQSFDQIPLAVIDNAHVLSDTTIQELFRYKDLLKQDHDVNFKLVLFASDGISNTLQKITSLQENKMYVQRMPIYSDKLAIDFISHKLRIAGYTGENLLTEKDYQLADKKSDGTALSLMHHITKIIEDTVAKKLKPPMPSWAKGLVGLAAVIIISTAVAIYLGLFDSQEIVSDVAHTSEPLITIEDATPDTDIADNISLSSDNVEATLDTIDSAVVDVEPTIAKDISNQAETAETVKENITTTALSPEEQLTPMAIKQLPSTEPVIDVAPIANNDAPDIKPQTIEVAPVKAAAGKATPEVKTITTPRPLVKKAHPALVQLNKMGLQDADWLLKQKDSEWTLQLLGAREPETLLAFSQQHTLGNETTWYKTWLKGQAYYVLIYGHYSSRDSARAAITTLPEKLRAIKPWVKSMKSAKDAIK